MTKKLTLSDLKPDQKNFNKGTAFGQSLVEKSLRKFGGARSIVLDKNNNIIAGNKTIEAAAAIGIEDVQIIESDGTKIIAVRRTDIDLNTPQGRELALADNASAKANIEFAPEIILGELGQETAEEWGVTLDNEHIEADKSNELSEQYNIMVETVSEKDQQKLFEELTTKGYKCKVLTL